MQYILSEESWKTARRYEGYTKYEGYVISPGSYPDLKSTYTVYLVDRVATAKCCGLIEIKEEERLFKMIFSKSEEDQTLVVEIINALIKKAL